MTGRADPLAGNAPGVTTIRFRPWVAFGLVVLPVAAGIVVATRLAHARLVPLVVFGAALPACWSLAASLLSLVSGRGLAFTLHPVTGNRNALDRVFVGVDVTNTKWWLPSLCLDVRQIVEARGDVPFPLAAQHAEALAGRQTRTFSWCLTVRRRGTLSMGAVTVTTVFPGSLLEVSVARDDGREWVCAPAEYRLRNEVLELLSGRRQSTGRPVVLPTAIEEFAGVREYRPQDNPRLISWPLTIRLPPHLEQFAVREFEDPGTEDVCIVLDSCVGTSDPDREKLLWQYEKAICFVRALIVLLTARRHRVRLVTVTAGDRTVELSSSRGCRHPWEIDGFLAALDPIAHERPVRQALHAQIGRPHGCVLFVSLKLTAEEEADRRLPVLSILPAWIPRLVERVVGA